MRFCEFALERYGDYEGLTVSVNSPGLNVIYGPNEAGKSTCLAAITDFLFGIPNNSSYGQRYGYGAMRIRALLLLPDGRRLDLRRRKGRERTLSDENGKPLDDSTLRGLLRDMPRERFCTLFGLGHESLRAGGRNLLQAEGDVGRLILEAGGGLRSLVERIDALEREAEGLFANRRKGDRRFYQLYDQFRTASDDVKQGTLTFEAYRQANENLTQAQGRHRALTEDRAALERRRSARERASRVLPLLAQLDQIEQEIETYGDVSGLRPEFATEVGEVLQARKQGDAELEKAADGCRALEGKIIGLPIDQAVINAEAEIRTMSEKASHVKRERGSRANREGELAEQQAKLVRLRELLNLDPEVDLKDHVPPGDVRESARQLTNEGHSLAEQIAGTEKQIRAHQRELDSLTRKQQILKENGFDRALTIQVPGADTLLRLLREVKSRNDRAAKFEKDVSHRLAAWGFSNVEELRDFRCPGTDVLEAEIERRNVLQQQIETQLESLRKAKEKLSLAQKAIERLQAAGEVPTDSAIDHARSARKSAWEPIRSVYLSDDPEMLRVIPRTERENNANRLEGRTEEADRLSDRKSAEAQRLTDLAAAEKDRDEAVIAINSSQEECGELRERLASESKQFTEGWLQAVARVGDLASLRQLVNDRDATLERAAEASNLRDEAENRQSEADDILASIARAEMDLRLSPTPQPRIEVRVHDLEQASISHTEGHRQWLQNSAKSEQLEAQLREAQAQLAEFKTTRAQWCDKWQEAMRRIDLPPDSSIEFAEQAILEWSEAQTALALISNIKHRLSQFDRDQKDLADRIATLSPGLSFQLPDDPVAAAEMLQERLENARRLEAQSRTLKTQKAEADEDHARKEQRVKELSRMVGGLCEEARADEPSLKGVVARLQQLIQRRRARDQRLEGIRAAGDGKPIEDLRAECAGLDPDGLRAEMHEIETDRERLDQEIQQAYAEIKSREIELNQFTAAAGINSAESRRQSAAAEMRAVIDRYLEVRLARELLTQAIDRLREERQNPLIARAGELFKLATRGAYAGIGTDIDDRGTPVVVGKRPVGTEVRVDLMSDGTRDQLFLAFRIASVEQYCTQSGPVPFIADDLLVHFDDERGAAALKLLAELGRNTQVLLFTHHRSVRDMAPAVLESGTFAITDLTA